MERTAQQYLKKLKIISSFLKKVSVGRSFNECIFRKNCEHRCRGQKCNINFCEYFKAEKCEKLNKAPYVCNGCPNKNFCTLEKHEYDALYAQKEYKSILSETRTGVNLTETEINNLNSILKPLIVKNGQSIHHAFINNKNKIMCSEKQIYNLIDKGILDIKNIDLPRKVRRKKINKKSSYKIDKQCRVNRTYEDFLHHIKTTKLPVVEMDTVEGIKGGKVLLTLHFVNCNFMIAFIRDNNDAQSVIDIFNYLEMTLGFELFSNLFQIILTDNGSEFSNPLELEFNPFNHKQRTKIFYCNPGHSEQKGSCENNHELIRRVLPKGTSFDDLTQENICLMMSHINSYKRKELNDCNPLQLFSILYDDNIATSLGILKIKPNDIVLNKRLLK